MSEREFTRSIRSRPTWAAWCLVLAAIGGVAAQPLYNQGLCYNGDENWSVTGGQFASHKAQSVVSVLLICEPVPRAGNACQWCLTYWTDVLQFGQWNVFDPGQTGTVTVACGDAEKEVWSTTFNAIPNGTYLTIGKLYDSKCDDANKKLVEFTSEPWSVTY